MGEIKCRKHCRDYTPARVHLHATLYIIDKLDYLKHTLRRRRLQFCPQERMGRLATSNQAANIFIKNLEQASSLVRAPNLSGIRDAFSPFTTLTILFLPHRIHQAVTTFALSLHTYLPSLTSTSTSTSIPAMFEI